MNVFVYGVLNHGDWHWEITLELRADFLFWHKQLQGAYQLLLLEPDLSIGQAFWLTQQLNTRSRRTPHRTVDQWKGEVEQLWSGGPHAGTTLPTPFKLTLIEKGKNDDIRSIGFHEFTGEEEKFQRLLDKLQGRSLLLEEWGQFQQILGLQWSESIQRYHLQSSYLEQKISLLQGIKRIERTMWGKSYVHYQCRRCGSGEEKMHWSYCHSCRDMCPYCEECLTMGRVRSCSMLIQGSVTESKKTPAQQQTEVPLAANWKQHLTEKWGLSPAQTEASLAGLRFLAQSENQQLDSIKTRSIQHFLIWAVTGAGKTEMIFPLLEYGLHRGQRVAVATPRKDVVLELAPRLQKAFPGYSLVTLYGGSTERWEEGDITLATTHQLLRFRHSFHIVVIDELDAFPYHNNPMLQYAASEVVVPGGRTLFLSATPPQAMQRDARWGRLPHVKVPVRYHRHPLPIPSLLRIRPIPYYLDKRQLPVGLYKALSASLNRGAQIFLFISKIKWVEPLVSILQQAFPETAIAGTASTDPERAEKVIAFRQKKITMLVTTTILERGVTVPKTDVFILNADAALFDEASLVQMAGRAGRSKDDPAGRVYFIASDVTRSQKGAIRQMRAMNRIADRQGYLLSSKAREPVKS